jgi:hypothetical protein
MCEFSFRGNGMTQTTITYTHNSIFLVNFKTATKKIGDGLFVMSYSACIIFTADDSVIVSWPNQRTINQLIRILFTPYSLGINIPQYSKKVFFCTVSKEWFRGRSVPALIKCNMIETSTNLTKLQKIEIVV